MSDVRVWGNQHGHGIIITGDLAEKIEVASALVGETPEQFVLNAIDRLVHE